MLVEQIARFNKVISFLHVGAVNNGRADRQNFYK